MHGEFRRNGIRWALDLNEGIDFAIYLLGQFERDLARSYRRLIPPGATVLDIGANIGAHTLPLAKHVGPTGRVIAIEATAYAYAKLAKNLSLNPQLAEHTTAIQALIAARDGTPAETSISSSWPLTGTEETDTIHGGALRSTSGAKVLSLDGLLTELEAHKIEWIKLDVDGHELDVLQGGHKCLETSKPSIFMELAPHCFEWNAFVHLVELLGSHNYAFFYLPGQKKLPNNAQALRDQVIPHGGSINILAQALY